MNIDFHVFVDNFVSAVEAKDSYTAGHSDRVADLSLLLAKAMELDEDDQYQIHMAAHLHDIGKIGIADGILLKTGKLSKAEFQVMKSHAEIGYNILKNNVGLRDIGQMILCHHEKYDGSGYPNGYSGDEIPRGARIIALCDAFDAMVTRRTYKDSMSLEDAIEEINLEKGKHFDPIVAQCFLDLLQDPKFYGQIQRIIKE